MFTPCYDLSSARSTVDADAPSNLHNQYYIALPLNDCFVLMIYLLTLWEGTIFMLTRVYLRGGLACKPYP